MGQIPESLFSNPPQSPDPDGQEGHGLIRAAIRASAVGLQAEELID
jgi:hypothetical protein